MTASILQDIAVFETTEESHSRYGKIHFYQPRLRYIVGILFLCTTILEASEYGGVLPTEAPMMQSDVRSLGRSAAARWFRL